MLEVRYNFEGMKNSRPPRPEDRHLYAHAFGMNLFQRGLNNSRWFRLRCWLQRRCHRLLDLSELLQIHQRQGTHAIGEKTIPINHIVGSESRSCEFDRAFNPTDDRLGERWIAIAAARYNGQALPVVDLIQVGELYFVRDGHHRISVAHTIGQHFIEAEIVRYEVLNPPSLATITSINRCQAIQQESNRFDSQSLLQLSSHPPGGSYV